MTERIPVDQAARDAITSQITESAFVEAGAGTGKSTTLVARVVRMVTEGGTPLRSIAAITFTERAAAELRDKVRGALEEHAVKAPSAAAEATLADVDAAVIGTIHGFALAVLREHAVVAGLPLGFAVVGEGDSQAARRGRARAIVEQLPSALPAIAADILEARGVDASSLLGLIQALDSATPRIDAAHVVDPPADDFEHLREAAVLGLTIFIDESMAACGDDGDKLALWIVDRVVQLRDQLAGADQLALTRVLVDYATYWAKVFKPGSVGAQKAWGSKDGAKAVRDALKACEPAVLQAITAPTDYAVRAALAIAWGRLTAARAARAAAGELEFDDLLLLTRDLLERDPEARRRVSERFRAVLVDEFQDTDHVQWRIVQLVTSEPSDPAAVPQPGRLVVVGDPKQAIYSFRGADIATYLLARQDFPGKSHSLATSFRSVTPLVAWFNAVFSELFVATDVQPAYEELKPFHEPTSAVPGGPTVVVLSDPPADPEAKPDEAASRALEPRLVATAIRRAVDDGWQITAPHPTVRTERVFAASCTFRDVAILVPTRTGVGALLDALDDAGIPFRTSDASLVLVRPAVSGLVASLRAIADPDDQLALWWALKSPLFGCGDDDLLRYRRAGGHWRLPRETDELPEGIVSDALRVLSGVRGVGVSPQPVDVLEALVSRCRLDEVLALVPRGSFETDCVRMLLGEARAWQESGGVGLDDYLTHVAGLESGQSRAGLDEPDDRDDDAVRISTIHGAKGLEYPVVVLAGMAPRRRTSATAIGVRLDRGFEFHDAGLTSTGYETWKAEERDPREAAELLRLLYVATTRARDHLVVSVVGAGAGRSRAAVLAERVLAVHHDVLITQPDPLPLPSDAALGAAWVEPADDWPEALDAVRARSAEPWVASPSGAAAAALGIEVAGGPESIVGELDAATPPVRPEAGERAGDLALDARDGRPLGRAVHAALDRVFRGSGRPGSDELAAMCGAAVADEGIPAALDDVVARVTAALATPLADEAFAAEHRHTELYLAAPVTGGSVRLVEGYADLVFSHGDGWALVDYKTDATLDPQARTHYAEQLAAYAALLERATGRPVTRRLLLHVPGTGAEIVDPGA
jgi:ATP-dependent exoDNAse (exonuclease V) beta subunit